MAKIHVTGAAGSGTSALGRALAETLNCAYFDADDYYWLPVDPPFKVKRPMPARIERLEVDLSLHSGCVLAGSICGWGDRLMPQFNTVVFLHLDPQIRLERLRARENLRFGPAANSPGGTRHAQFEEFMSWAASYDHGGLGIRSRALHDQWLLSAACPVVRLDSLAPVSELVAQFRGLPPNPSLNADVPDAGLRPRSGPPVS